MKSNRTLAVPGRALFAGAFGASLLAFAAPDAEACCPGFNQQCGGSKSVWCVQSTAPAGTLPPSFCPYGDEVVTELESLFNIQAPGTFEFDVDWPATGGAHTGTECGTFGDSVTGDAFTNRAYNVPGFWGYLLALHEAINDWTGLSSGGWPTDYWADHISAFPNEMDWRIMGTLGAALSDPNLIAASPAQKARFWPGGDSEDSRVQMFDSMFILPSMGNGYSGFSRIFALVQGDKVAWDSVATNRANPDERRSEYVAAYLSLGAGKSVLPIMQNPSAGYAASHTWPVCAGKWDGVSGDPNPSYTCSEANIDAIATAHCAIAANGRPSSDLQAFQAGNYGAVKAGPCGAACPGECACDSSKNQCVAPWLVAGGTGSCTTPGGSYSQSCTGCQAKQVGSACVLTCADCTEAGGVQNPNPSLTLPCTGDISNQNGVLSCSGGTTTCTTPTGSYSQSCTGCQAKAAGSGCVLACADCREANGTQNPNPSLALPCAGDISNQNGALSCSGGTTTCTTPTGSYSQSCTGCLAKAAGSACVLTCGDCKEASGAQNPNPSLNLPCAGDISNQNGVLSCIGGATAAIDRGAAIGSGTAGDPQPSGAKSAAACGVTAGTSSSPLSALAGGGFFMVWAWRRRRRSE